MSGNTDNATDNAVDMGVNPFNGVDENKEEVSVTARRLPLSFCTQRVTVLPAARCHVAYASNAIMRIASPLNLTLLARPLVPFLAGHALPKQ
jgi:hypothetical protein